MHQIHLKLIYYSLFVSLHSPTGLCISRHLVMYFSRSWLFQSLEGWRLDDGRKAEGFLNLRYYYSRFTRRFCPNCESALCFKWPRISLFYIIMCILRIRNYDSTNKFIYNKIYQRNVMMNDVSRTFLWPSLISRKQKNNEKLLYSNGEIIERWHWMLTKCLDVSLNRWPKYISIPDVPNGQSHRG